MSIIFTLPCRSTCFACVQTVLRCRRRRRRFERYRKVRPLRRNSFADVVFLLIIITMERRRNSQSTEGVIKIWRIFRCPSEPESMTTRTPVRVSARTPPHRSARKRSGRRRKLVVVAARKPRLRPNYWTSCTSSNSSRRRHPLRPSSIGTYLPFLQRYVLVNENSVFFLDFKIKIWILHQTFLE